MHALLNVLLPMLRSHQGAAMPIIAISFGVLVLAAGGAIDASRAHLVEAKLSSSLDAAGLAAGSSISTSNLTNEVDKYFYANYPDGYMGSTVTNLSATLNSDSTLIDLTATATLPTTLLALAGQDQFTITVNSQITRQSKGLELVLVVDTSGSMDYSAGGGKTRLEAAQDAIEIMMDILYGATDDTQENLWVGVVPFAHSVNVGDSRTGWVSTDSYYWGTTSWGGCVEERAPTGRDVTDDPPTTELFEKYYYPCDSNNKWYGTDSYEKNCSTGSGVDTRSGVSNYSYGPNYYCTPNPVVSLRESKSDIVSEVNAMDAWGGTHTVTGVAWAYRMLSPDWQGLWGDEMDSNNLPLAYGTENMEKAVIILSDGDNTAYSWLYTAYNYLSAMWLGTTSTSAAANELDDRTEEVCDAMKDDNIIIYTIAFGTSISSQGKDLMEDCASKADYYFESPNVDDLETAFQTIGDSLANLRVSQ